MQTFLIGRANLTDVSFVWDAKAFGERIRSARGDRKAEAVAGGAEIAPETLSRYENGKMPNISVFVAKRIAEALNTTLGQLLGEEVPTASPVAIGSESIFPIRCEAVNVSAGPGAPWTEYPTKDDRDRHYFYRRSFVRAALNIPEDACGRCNQRAYEDEYITGPLPSRHCALDISRRARSDARDEPLDDARLGVVQPTVRRADERAPVR